MYVTRLLALFLLISFSLLGGFEKHLKPGPKGTKRSSIRNIDYIVMINLDQRPEKLERSFKQLQPYGIKPARFSAVNGWDLTVDAINDLGVKYEPWMKQGMMATYFAPGEDGQAVSVHEIMQTPGRTYFVHCIGRGTLGIELSHLSILKHAYDAGYKTIWVMEDDIDVMQDPTILSDLIDKLDGLVGKKGWDILFTDIDFRDRSGQHISCNSFAPRPNFTPEDPSKFAIREVISPDFTRIGARYGAHSMIVRRSGMRKILEFTKKYSIFLPYDMDNVLPPDMKLFSLNYDVVSQLTHAISDNGTPPPK